LKYLRNLSSGSGPARILGWTTATNDFPIRDADIVATGDVRTYRTQSGGRGTFELSGVIPGKYRLTATRDQYESALPFEDVEVVPGGCAVVPFLFGFQGKIQGTVRDRKGRPQQGVQVDLLLLDDSPEANWFDSRVTDTEGRYSFGGLEAGRYRAGVNLRLKHNPYPTLYAPGVEDPEQGLTFEISEDQPGVEANIWLPEPKFRPFEILVCWPDGRPAIGARIELRWGRWADKKEVLTNQNGLIILQGYELLLYRLRAVVQGQNANEESTSMFEWIPPGGDKVYLRLDLSEHEAVDVSPSEQRH